MDLKLQWYWLGLPALTLAITAASCGDGSDSSVAVEYDGEPFRARNTAASLFDKDGYRSLSVTVSNAHDEDDGEWFTLTVELAPEAIAGGTALAIDGSSILVDRVEGENGYPQEEDLSFEAGPGHDPRVLRAWLFHHAWFSGWGGDQQQTIAGELAIEEVASDGTVHGTVDVEVFGNMPPVSFESDHEATLRGSFSTSD